MFLTVNWALSFHHVFLTSLQVDVHIKNLSFAKVNGSHPVGHQVVKSKAITAQLGIAILGLFNAQLNATFNWSNSWRTEFQVSADNLFSILGASDHHVLRKLLRFVQSAKTTTQNKRQTKNHAIIHLNVDFSRMFLIFIQNI